MNPLLKRWLPWTLAVLLVLLFTFAVFSPEEPAPVWTFHSGPYQVEILTPGGVFREGNNNVEIRAWRNKQPVEIRHGRLDLSMLWTDMKPHMHAQAQFSRHASLSALEGTLHFTMSGTWNGRVEVTSPTETLADTFRIEVVE